MKGQPAPPAQNVRGQLLGREITTRAALPTTARAIGVEVGALLRPLQEGARGRQFVPPALLAAWPELVGPRLAGLCMPVQMKAQRAARAHHKKPGEDGAVLEVSADRSVQVDLDYGQGLIIERVNAFFGYRAVARLKVLARPVDGRPAAAQGAPARPAPPSPQAQGAARAATADVADPHLRAALEKLGASILAGER